MPNPRKVRTATPPTTPPAIAPVLLELPLNDDLIDEVVGIGTDVALGISAELVESVLIAVDKGVVIFVGGVSAARKYWPENSDASQLNSVKTLPGDAVVDHWYTKQYG